MIDEPSIPDIIMVFIIMFVLATIVGDISIFLLAFVACVVWVLIKNWLMGQGIEL